MPGFTRRHRTALWLISLLLPALCCVLYWIYTLPIGTLLNIFTCLTVYSCTEDKHRPAGQLEVRFLQHSRSGLNRKHFKVKFNQSPKSAGLSYTPQGTTAPQPSLLVRGQTLWPHLDFTDLWSSLRTLPSPQDLYPDTYDVDKVLYGLATARLERVELFSPAEPSLSVDKTSDLGSTHKWLLVLEGGQRAVFKPQWYERRHIKEQWYLGYELHTSEITAFHLDRLLGFRRTPFTVGRRLDVRNEVFPVASSSLLGKFIHRGGEVCIEDQCYMCERPLVTCTKAGALEGAVILYLDKLSPAQPAPWGPKSYFLHKKFGFNNGSHCSEVRASHPLLSSATVSSASVFLDLMDMAVLDYITYHFDAKFYSLTSAFDVHTTVHLDRGRALTRPDKDDLLAMLGVWQCCRMRRKTYNRLITLRDGRLISVLRKELSRDPISPPEMLTEDQLEAVQRRLSHVLTLVNKCLAANDVSETLMS